MLRWRKEVMRGHKAAAPIVLVGVVLFLASCFGWTYGEKPATPVRISPPTVYVHCERDDRGLAFILRWEYAFRYSARDVTGFRIYRRTERADYALLSTVRRDETPARVSVIRQSINEYVYRYRDQDVRPGVTYRYKIVAFDPVGNEGFNEVRIRTDPTADPVAGPENVLVVVIRSVPESVEIGEYYQRRRGIPKQNVLAIPYRGNTEILSVRNFERDIRLPIREYLTSQRLQEKILCIVITYGFPYKIAVPGGKIIESLDAHLTDLLDEYRNDPNYEITAPGARYKNPYYLARGHFSRANGNRGYLVTRLDGPLASPDDKFYNRNTDHRDDPLQYLKNMVDFAIWAERNAPRLPGKGYFDRRYKTPWAFFPGIGDYFINGAYDCSAALGYESILDTNPELIGTVPRNSGGSKPLFCDEALWYAGWYAHFYRDVFEWNRGAIGFHLESWTAQNIRTQAKYRGRPGWLWVPGMIRAGVTATMGAVHEPQLGGLPRIDWFFRYFFHGFSFAEAAYMASPFAAGQIAMFGDPLYNPFRNKRLDHGPPTITLTSPKPGQTARGTKVLVEGILDDPIISMLDNWRPVSGGKFSYEETIGSYDTDRATLPVIVNATDASGNTISKTVLVNWVNEPPRFEPIEAQEVNEGEMLRFTLKTRDSDGDTLSYRFTKESARPRGATLDSKTGKFEWKPESDQAGKYEFLFIVSDRFASDEKKVTVNVKQSGSHPPKFEPLPKKLVGKSGKVIYLQLKAEDADGDSLIFSTADPLPPGARLIQLPPNHAVFLWQPTSEQVGSHKIIFTVSDGEGGEDTATVEVEIASDSPPIR